jgi:hypothetical protein
MNKTILLFTGSMLAVSAGSALADRVGGSPKANFSTNELTIPCVRIEGLSDATEGMFYDIVLVRRGSSYNYELSAAEPEDSALCQRIADFSEYEDDDYSGDDDDSGDDDSTDSPDILVQCEVTQTRSKISVKGKDLEPGDYQAVITSGSNTLQSMTRTITDDEVEFDFDSDSGDVLEGAEAIGADFIVDAEVKAEIFRDGASDALLDKTASCLAAG